jgi:hypothetical protein
LNLDVLDYASASEFLHNLIKERPSLTSQKWADSIVGTWWDLLGFFGFNLTKGLSPIINDLAVDSLTSEESKEFNEILRSSLISMILQGSLDAFSQDVTMYSLIRRKYSFEWYAGAWPSAERILSEYSKDMSKHLYRPITELETYTTEELLFLAFSRFGFISNPFEEPKKLNKSRSKSMELSKKLINDLWAQRPHLALKLIANSQAFCPPKN